MASPSVKPDEERVRLERKHGQRYQQATGQSENPGEKVGHCDLHPKGIGSPIVHLDCRVRKGRARVTSGLMSLKISSGPCRASHIFINLLADKRDSTLIDGSGVPGLDSREIGLAR